MKSTSLIAFGVFTLTSFAFTAQAQLNATTVGLINPSGTAFVNSPVNVGNSSFVTEASMVSLMNSAYSGNTGGVVNWEAANGWTVASTLTNATLSYGTSQSQSLVMTETQPFPGQFGGASAVGTTLTSGTQFLGLGSNQTPIFNFSAGLVAWGMFLLDRGATRSAGLTFTLADNSTITYAADTLNSPGAAIWFGVQASASNPIMSVAITGVGGNFTGWDDMAFIVAPVPEPATLTLLGLGSLAGIMAIRRRRS